MKVAIALTLVLASSISLAACSQKADDRADAANTMAAEAVDGAESAVDAATGADATGGPVSAAPGNTPDCARPDPGDPPCE